MILSATFESLGAFNKAICLYAQYNITSNIIAPGGVLTEIKVYFYQKVKREDQIQYSIRKCTKKYTR